LAGTIRNADGHPISQAQIAVRGTPLTTVAAIDGAFRLLAVPARRHTLDVRMLGYQPRALPVEMLAGETLHVQVMLVAVALPLDTVAVSSDREVSPAMRGFEQRRARGPGVFFNRDDIQRMQPRVLTDVLRRVPGLQVRPVRGGLGNNVTVQTRGSECPALFYMNGSAFPLPSDQPINHFVAPEEVIGIEVYAGSSEIPAQFNSSRFNSRCGVIVIWTRYGPEKRRR
jgi:vitamin B12 transporter